MPRIRRVAAQSAPLPFRSVQASVGLRVVCRAFQAARASNHRVELVERGHCRLVQPAPRSLTTMNKAFAAAAAVATTVHWRSRWGAAADELLLR